MVQLEASADTSVIDEFENVTACALLQISIVYKSSFFFAIISDTFATTNIRIENGPLKRTCTSISNNQGARTSAENDSSYFEFGKDLKFLIKNSYWISFINIVYVKRSLLLPFRV